MRKLKYMQKSKNVSISDIRLLYRFIISEDLQRLFGPGPVNTDSRPFLEFTAPKLIYQEDRTAIGDIQHRIWVSPGTREINEQLRADIDAQIDFAAYALSVYSPFKDMVDLSKATSEQEERFFSLLDDYCANNTVDVSDLKDNELMRRCRSVQMAAIKEKIDLLPDKAVSYDFLGSLYYKEGRLDESIINYSKSLQIDPVNAAAHLNLGSSFAKQGNFEKAVSHFVEVLRIDPNNAKAYKNFGYALMFQGRFDYASTQLLKALQLDPVLEDVHNYLGYVLTRQGRFEEAVRAYNYALEKDPDNPDIYNGMGIVLTQQGRKKEAVRHFTRALEIRPDWVEVMNNLSWILATREERQFRDPKEAIRLAERAGELTGFKKPDLLDTLAVAYGADGRFSDAVSTAQKAVDLARSSGDKQLAEEIRGRLRLFKAGQRYVEGASR